MCSGFYRGFSYGSYPAHSRHPDARFTLSLRPNNDSTRSRPHPKFYIFNPPSIFSCSPSHFVPIYCIILVSRRPRFFPTLNSCPSSFSPHGRLKRPPSSSLHRTLHHLTSILPIPGTSVSFIGLPLAFLGSFWWWILVQTLSFSRRISSIKVHVHFTFMKFIHPPPHDIRNIFSLSHSQPRTYPTPDFSLRNH